MYDSVSSGAVVAKPQDVAGAQRTRHNDSDKLTFRMSNFLR